MARFFAVSVAAAGLIASMSVTDVTAADLVTPLASEKPASPADVARDSARLHDALSEYLDLLMIRATFDVVETDTLESRLTDELRIWGGAAPAAAAKDDLDRQLLAEGSYYLVSLSYTIKVGGAAFPDDKAEMVYANDAIVELDDLQRAFADAIAAGADVTPILERAEEIRALTEGYAEVPDDFGIFNRHAAILDSVIEAAARGAKT